MRHIKKTTTILLLIIVLGFSVFIVRGIKNNVYLFDEVNVIKTPPIPSSLTSSKYTQVDDLSIVDDNPYLNLDGYESLGIDSNTNLELLVNKDYLSLRIINHNTGYIWGSNMDYDYLHEDNPLYNPNDLGSQNYLDPEYEEDKDTFVRQDRSPVVITYYNKLSNNVLRSTEYFFGTRGGDGRIIYEDLSGKIGFKANLKMALTGISFDLTVYLDENGLNVKIPYESIKDNEPFIISTINVYRLLGFSKADYTKGYVFIPDGIGALIRFDGENKGAFSKKFYGPDYTLSEKSNEEPLTASVYGLVHGINQNAMLAIVKSGAPNAQLSYRPADNVSSDFNTAQVTFEYRNTYIQKLNQSGTSTIELIESNIKPYDIHIIYQFLEGDDANYVGFGNKYRDYLINNGYNFNKLDEVNSIPLHLDILALENKVAWYGKEVFKMTNVNEINNIINDLISNDINHLDISIHGWQKGGESYTTPNYNNIDSKFGNVNKLYEDNLIDYYFKTTPFYAYKGASGYSNNNVALTEGSDFATYKDNYLLKLSDALIKFQNNYKKISKKGIENITLEEVGNILYSNHDKDKVVRSNAIEIIRELLLVANKTETVKPFDYMWDSTIISDINLYSSNQIKFTDTVPFIPIVLSGYKKVYGRHSNFFSNTSNEMLRMVDYHLFPNFYITEESAQKLLNTGSSQIFTSRFKDWEEEIYNEYNYLNNALLPVYNASFKSREIIKPGLVKNTYDNGVIIYINYTKDDETHEGIIISKMDYKVIS